MNAQLNKKYRKLGSAEVPITDMLFGNDLKVACANNDTTSKMGLSFSQSNANKSQKFFSTKHILCKKKKNLKNQTCFKNKVQGNLRKEMDTDIEKLLSMG